MKNLLFTLVALGLALWAVVCVQSCGSDLLYSAHRSVPHAQWDSRDTLLFALPPSADGADVALWLSVRGQADMDYRTAVLRVVQVQRGKPVCADTAAIAFYDAADRWLGHGPLGGDCLSRPLRLHRVKGVADTVLVTHTMRQDPLEGISKVCIFVEKIAAQP